MLAPDLADVAAADVTTMVQGRPDPRAATSRRFRRIRPVGGRLSRFRRSLVSLTVATCALLGVSLGQRRLRVPKGCSLSIGMGCEPQPYTWYWDSYWNGYAMVDEPVIVLLPCAGGGAWYCWAWSDSCWYEQWPWRLP
jgi:hypothetical protein